MLELIECYTCSFCKSIFPKKDFDANKDRCTICACSNCGKNTDNNQSFDFKTYCRLCFCKEAIKREKEDIEDRIKRLHELEEELRLLNESDINSSI